MPDGGRLPLARDGSNVGCICEPISIHVPPGHYARLTVTDSGSGMDADILAKVFEPFVMTKKVRGDVVGFGHATAPGVVKLAGGHIAADSIEGRGSTFPLLLPLVTTAPRGEARLGRGLPVERWGVAGSGYRGAGVQLGRNRCHNLPD